MGSDPLGAVTDFAVGLMERLGGPGAALAVLLENFFPPIPSEVILPLAGFTASQGELSLVAVILWTVVGSVVGAAGLYGLGAALGIEATPESIETGGMIGFFVAIFLAVIIFYVVLGLIALAFYAKFFREVVGATRWKDLEFSFNASTRDWLVLFLGDIVLVVLTLGIGSIFLSYRHWKFFITHMEASGEILLDELTQSETRMASQGEGLLDAFDIGAV